MKTELLRMLSPDALDMGKVGGGWASLTPQDIAAALAGLDPGPYYLAMSVYVADAIAYSKLYVHVAGMSGIPKKPEGLKAVSKVCTECGGETCRIYTDAGCTIPLSRASQAKVVKYLKDGAASIGVGFDMRPGDVIEFFHSIFIAGKCLHCNGEGTIPLRPVDAILDLCMDELFGDNMCGSCYGAKVTHEQQTCETCKGAGYKKQSDLTRSKITGIPYEFWGRYKGFYERLYTTLTDYNAQIATHMAKRMAEAV